MKKILYVVLLCCLVAAPAGAAEDESLVGKGNLLWSEGRLEQAESMYRSAIRQDPDAALPHARLAALLLTENRNHEARKEYQNAIMNDPEDPDLFLALAIVYLHEKSYSNAQVMLNRALALDPGRESAMKLQQYVTARITVLDAPAGDETAAPPVMPLDASLDGVPREANPHHPEPG